MRDEIIAFKSRPESIDVENRVLRNVLLAQVGEAEGHGVHIEEKFIDKLLELSGGELKSNFGHNHDNLGFQLGRAKGIRKEGLGVVGDLHVYRNADNSPHFPNMGTWFLNQANEDPESVMLSIRFKASHHYQYDSTGREMKLNYERGRPKPLYKDKPIYVGLSKVYSVDVVDEGALTNNLFNSTSENTSFFSRFLNFFNIGNMTEQDIHSEEEKAIETQLPTSEPTTTEKPNADQPIAELSAQFEGISAALTQLSQKVTDLTAQTEELTAKYAAVTAENEALKSASAGDLTNGATGMSRSDRTQSEYAALGEQLRRGR